MPRRPRCNMGGYVYHVLNRAVGRATLFYQEGDYAAFENTLRAAKEWQPITPVQVQATDLDGYTLSYEATNLPSGLSINDSGLISGTIDPSAASPTAYQVTVEAEDPNGMSAEQTFNWTVTGAAVAPQLTNPGNQVNAAGDYVDLSLTGTSSSQNTLTYTAANLPAGLTIDPSTGEITGTIANSAASSTPYTVTVTASDGTLPNNQSFTWTVNDVGLPSPGAQSNLDGDVVSLQMTATTATGNAPTYTATGLPPGLTINSNTGLIAGTISTTADLGSPYSTNVTGIDGSNNASQKFQWTVAPMGLTNPGNQVCLQGTFVSLPVTGTYVDGTLSYRATGLPPGLSINSSTGLISGTVGAPSASSNPYQVTVKASASSGGSGGGTSVQQSFALTLTPQVTLFNPGSQFNAAGDSVSCQVIASVPSGTLSYSATGLPSGLSINSNTGLIGGTISLSASSNTPYNVTVTAGNGTYNNSQTFSWSVTPIAVPAPGNPDNFDGDGVSLSFAASYHGSGTLSYSATGLPPGLGMSSTTGLVSGTITATDDANSPYSVTVTATAGTNTGTQTFSWEVDPRITLDPVANQTNGDGDVVSSLDLTATDAAQGTITYGETGLPSGLTINCTTGVISGTIAAGDDTQSPYQVTVTAGDGYVNVSQSFTWTVGRISLTNPGTQFSVDGQTLSLAIQGKDVNGPSVTFSATGLPSGLGINSSTGLITGTLSNTADQGSHYLVTVTASDPGYSASQTFQWQVQKVGVVAIADQTNQEGQSVSLPTQGLAPSGTNLTYSATGLPDGLSINTSTGVISGTLIPGAAEDGPYSVTVAASGGGNAFSQSFTWTINPYITVTQPADQTNVEGNQVTLDIQATDAGNNTMTYSAVGLPTGLTINANTGVISGTIATGDSLNGPYYSTVTVLDGTYSTIQGWNWTVNPASPATPPSVVNLGNQNSQAGENVTLDVQATSPGGYSLSYSATNLPDGLSIDPNSGIISGTVADDAAGPPVKFTVTVTDSLGDATNQSFYWGVVPAPLTAHPDAISAEEGVDPGSVTLAIFTTPDINPTTDDFSATVNWGDGNTDDDATISGQSGSFTVTDDHIYANVGTYTFQVRIYEDDGSTATVSGTATVTDAPLTIEEPSPYQLGAVVGQSTTFTLANFIDQDPEGYDTNYYTSTVTWGDNNGGPSYVSFNSTGFGSVTGMHTYTQTGTYTVNITIQDSSGATASTFCTIVVGNAYAGIQGTLGTSGFLESSPCDPATAITATVNWGDGSQPTNPTVAGSNGLYYLTGTGLTHTYTVDGSFTITVTIHDTTSGSTLTGTGGTMIERPPDALVAGDVENEGLTLTNVELATFSEPDVSDPISEFSATIYWGDGTSSSSSGSGNVTISGGGGVYVVSGSHTYASGNVYNITVDLYQGWSLLFLASESPTYCFLLPFSAAVSNINATDTPQGMPARIMPANGAKDANGFPVGDQRIGFSVYVGIALYELAVQNGFAINVTQQGTANPQNGNFSFIGERNNKLVPSTYLNLLKPNQGYWHCSLYGTQQTAATNGKNASQLKVAIVAVKGNITKTLAVSNGFSVAAIPINMKISDRKNYQGKDNPFNAMAAGITNTISWESDADPKNPNSWVYLSAVYMREILTIPPILTGAWAGLKVIPLYLKDYPPAPANRASGIDYHVLPTDEIDRALNAQIVSSVTMDQLYLFRDARTGAVDIPVPNSGFLLQHFVTNKAQNKPGKWYFTTYVTAMPAKIKVTNDITYSSGPGLGKIPVGFIGPLNPQP